MCSLEVLACKQRGLKNLDAQNCFPTNKTNYNMGILFPTLESKVQIIRPLINANKRWIADLETELLSKVAAKKTMQ
jgi:hypothetical protein